MHPSFPDWYGLAGLKPDAETLLNRSQVIGTYAKNITSTRILELAGFFIGKVDVYAELREELNKVFQEADPTFSIKNNLLELRVLAGSLLVELMEGEPGSRRLVAAMSVECCKFGVPIQKVLIQDVVTISAKALNQMSTQVRNIGSLDRPTLSPPKIENFVDPNQWGPQLKDFTRSSSSAINRIEQVLAILAEESNILWWLLADFSNALNRPFKEVNPACLSLISAKELADLTVLLPGPGSASASLSRIIGNHKSKPTFKVVDAVNSLPKEWREMQPELENKLILGVLAPISLAIAKSLETDSESAWVAVFNKASGLSARSEHTRLELGTQYYQESLLLRAITA